MNTKLAEWQGRKCFQATPPLSHSHSVTQPPVTQPLLLENCTMINTMYRCEICDDESLNPVRWVVIHCDRDHLTIHRWSLEAAEAAGARHYCGESHAQIYVSRWFESFCG